MTRTEDLEIADEVLVEPRDTALLIVDMQNDFVRPDGKLPVPAAAPTVPTIARLRERMRGQGVRVFYTQDSHLDGDPEFALWGEHVLEGSEGWQIVDGLSPGPGEQVIRKRHYDPFIASDLDERLRRSGIGTLVICGTVTDICVLYTAAGAAMRNYRVILPVDGTSALVEQDGNWALRHMATMFGCTLTRSDGVRVRG